MDTLVRQGAGIIETLGQMQARTPPDVYICGVARVERLPPKRWLVASNCIKDVAVTDDTVVVFCDEQHSDFLTLSYALTDNPTLMDQLRKHGVV